MCNVANPWKDIWNNEDRIQNYLLEALLKIDGFDDKAGNFTVQNYIEYANTLKTYLMLDNSRSIFEVGCGAGAFLYFLSNLDPSKRLGGIDYCPRMVEIASRILPTATIRNQEAIELETHTKFDVVFAHSVLQYFPNLEYASEVISRMIKKSTHTIVLLDVCDMSKQKEYLEFKYTVNSKDYSNLPYQFYDKNFFRNIADIHSLECKIIDQNYKNYFNSKYRYNVIFTKTER